MMRVNVGPRARWSAVAIAGWILVPTAVLAPTTSAVAEDAAPAEIRAAVQRALPPLEQGAVGYTRQRACFSCHNQAVPIFAFTAARSAGIPLEASTSEALAGQVRHTAAFLATSKANYLMGKGQGGQALTAGYALWALSAGGYVRDETTDAVTGYLLTRDAATPFWKPTTNRPPTEGSLQAATFTALKALSAFASPERREAVEARRKAALEWLKGAAGVDTEDRTFRLLALREAGAGSEVISEAITALIRTQRADGGWSQLDGGESDAYATASAMVALADGGAVKASDPAYQRGVAWLLKAQLPDGTWKVVTRSKPIQTYFESGFPHGKDQFISSAASGWAVVALSRSLRP